MGHVSLETSVCWLSEDVASFEIGVGGLRETYKNVTVISRIKRGSLQPLRELTSP